MQVAYGYCCCCYNKNTQRNTLMYFIYLPFKKARSISKCSSLRSERLGFKMSLPLLNNLSNAALEGKEVLYWTNGFFNDASAKKLSSIFFAGTDGGNPSILIII